MGNLIRIPKRYYDDHRDCISECESPKVIKETKSHYYVEATPGEEWDEFVERCEFYAEPYIDATIENGLWSLVHSARATIKAIKAQTH